MNYRCISLTIAKGRLYLRWTVCVSHGRSGPRVGLTLVLEDAMLMIAHESYGLETPLQRSKVFF
jgi:hypothetical protein